MGLTLVFVAMLGCEASKDQSKTLESSAAINKTNLKIEQFCGNCHPLPSPATFPKSSWPAEVERGFQFYLQSGRSDLDEPLVLEAQKYYQSRAPEKIEIPSATSFPENSSNLQFAPSPLLLSGDKISLTADIRWSDDKQTLYFSDMANSKLRSWSLKDNPDFVSLPPTELKVLTDEHIKGHGNHLCRITPCDWNGDGIQDFLAAEIGSMIISDQKLGDIALYIGSSNNSFERKLLASKLARPVESVPIDYDGDGDMDIVIAEFGYNTVGCLSLLRNRSGEKSIALSQDDFDYETIDSRHGHLAVTLADMNKDGKTDIVTAIGQEYETVQIRYALGDGKYRSEIVLALPDPSYNTSSIQVCDVNQDGHLDILHTCGDIFDSFIPKEFHGVRLILNLGNGRWETRELGMLVGAMQTTTADFDGDGDLDIAAVGLFPGSATYSPGVSYDSVVWWEQRPNLEFVRHSIERDRCLHSSCTSADIDRDGRPDLIVGEWAEGAEPSSLRIFWNRNKPK